MKPIIITGGSANTGLIKIPFIFVNLSFFRLLVFLIFMFLLLTSCTKLDKSVIRFGLSSVVQKLDPRYSTDATSTRIIRLIYRQLVDFDKNLRPVADLASWKVISPTHYRFTLGKTGRVFHDGSRLEAKDVKATYDAVLGRNISHKINVRQGLSPHRTSIELIKSIIIIDSDTVDFYLERVDPAFPGYLVIGIMPASLLIKGHDFNRQPVGSGRFRFVRWPEQDILKLIRIRDKQQFTFIHVNNATTRVLKLLRGEIDIVQNNLPIELIKYLGKNKKIKIMYREGSNFSYLGFNLKDKYLKDRRVRLAIAYAIDRKRIINKMFGSKTRLAAAIFTPDHWAGHPTLKSWPYDPIRAKQLLKEAGFGPQNPLQLLYKTTNNPFRVRIATILQYQLGQVGIKVKLRTYEWTTFYNDIKRGNFHIYTLSWVAVKSPDMFRYVYHSDSIPGMKIKGSKKRSKGANRNRFSDKLVDQYIEQAEKTLDQTKRVVLYRKIHERLIELLPVIPLWYDEHMAAMRLYIKGYRIAYDGSFDSLNSVYLEHKD